MLFLAVIRTRPDGPRCPPDEITPAEPAQQLAGGEERDTLSQELQRGGAADERAVEEIGTTAGGRR